jgi:hypothetical protein
VGNREKVIVPRHPDGPRCYSCGGRIRDHRPDCKVKEYRVNYNADLRYRLARADALRSTP